MVTPPPWPVTRQAAAAGKSSTPCDTKRVASLVVEGGRLHWELLSEGLRALEHAVETLGFLSQGVPAPQGADAGYLRAELIGLLKKFDPPPATSAAAKADAKPDAAKTGGVDRALPVGDR